MVVVLKVDIEAIFVFFFTDRKGQGRIVFICLISISYRQIPADYTTAERQFSDDVFRHL